MATWKLAVLVFIISSVVFAGALVVAIVSVPALYDRAMSLIPGAAIVGFAAAAVFSFFVARSLNAKRPSRAA
jgi:hypothetical protein